MNEKGFVHHSEKCLQCHTCELACKSWRGLSRGGQASRGDEAGQGDEAPDAQDLKWRRVYNIWRGEYPDVTASTVSVPCMHCDICDSGTRTGNDMPICVISCPTQALELKRMSVEE